jgi:hypothetical protein
MRLNDGPADRQSHRHSIGLRGVEGRDNAFETFRIDARPGIATATSAPLWCCSVLINSARALASLEEPKLQLHTIAVKAGPMAPGE